jgi:hypothetical protein
MTESKLIETWIEDNASDFTRDGVYLVPADRIRALLSKYRLCEREPVVYQYLVNGAFAGYSKLLPPPDAYDEGSLLPLYAEAKEEK